LNLPSQVGSLTQDPPVGAATGDEVGDGVGAEVGGAVGLATGGETGEEQLPQASRQASLALIPSEFSQPQRMPGSSPI